ncbi:MAG: GNAT family N-acetyltransferase [Acidobacteria bacterium]|nr:MAG: GNAT family N-acetyltransferase [Acidobacteriota bacterium]
MSYERDYVIRKATLDDREAIKRLIGDSARLLSRDYYRDIQIESAIESVFGVDTDLIDDGTYFVAEHRDGLVGCGGWSKRKTLFGGDQFTNRTSGMLDPASEPAKIRAFFIHPQHARKGIAGQILEHCETEARAGGFQSLELMATLPGVPFYTAAGFTSQAPFALELPDGVVLELLSMRKEL